MMMECGSPMRPFGLGELPAFASDVYVKAALPGLFFRQQCRGIAFNLQATSELPPVPGNGQGAKTLDKAKAVYL
jgi:hypothetical protein